MSVALMKNAGLATGGVLVQGLARFIYTIVIGRALGADTLGEVSGLLALAVFVSLFWATSSGVGASRFIARDRANGLWPSPSVRLLNRGFLVSLPLLAVVTFCAAFSISGDVPSSLAGVALAASFSAYAYTRGAGLGVGVFGKVALLDAISSVVSLGLLVLVVVGGLSWQLLLPLTIGYAVFAAVLWPRGSAGKVNRPEIVGFVFVNSLAQIAAGGLLQIAMLVARTSDTSMHAGFFAAAFSLATPASMIGLSINQVLIPHFAAMSVSARALVVKSTVRITTLVALGLAVVFGAVILVASVLLDVLYGAQFEGALGYLRWMLLFVYLYSVSLVPAASLIATSRDRQYTLCAGASFLVGTAVMVALAPRGGAWAAVWGYGAATLLSTVLITALAVKTRR